VEEPKNKSSFCIKPFNSALIDTDGTLRTCCQTTPTSSEFKNNRQYNIKNDTIDEWWNSDYLKYLRQSFLQDKRIRECDTCWKLENQGLSSLRTASNYLHKSIFKNKYERNLKLIGKDALAYPEDVEIHITNLCNLKCQMCTGANSSRLLIENNALGYENLNQKDYDLNDADYEKMKELSKHDLKWLNLRGGEPLMNKRVLSLLLDLVSVNKANQTSLHITTNGTMCDSKIINILKHFKKVTLMLSIEATGKHNEYMRYPSSWNVIKNNIDQFKTLDNVYIYINSVVQNLNILYIDQLIEYSYENNFFIHLSKIFEPEYLDIFNLPKKTLEQAYDNLKKIPDKKLVHTANVKEIIFSLKEQLENYSINDTKYKQFIAMIKKRDHYRRIHIKDYMPELAMYLNI